MSERCNHCHFKGYAFCRSGCFIPYVLKERISIIADAFKKHSFDEVIEVNDENHYLIVDIHGKQFKVSIEEVN